MTGAEDYAKHIDHWLNVAPTAIEARGGTAESLEAARLVAAALAAKWAERRLDATPADDANPTWREVRDRINLADHPALTQEEAAHERFTAYRLALKAYQQEHHA
jgi:hypothetical protein